MSGVTFHFLLFQDQNIVVWQRSSENGVTFLKHFCQDMAGFNWIHTWYFILHSISIVSRTNLFVQTNLGQSHRIDGLNSIQTKVIDCQFRVVQFGK